MYVPDGWINRHIPQAHVEKAQDCWDYERKEHNFISWEDTPDVLKIRYGELNNLQKCMLAIVRTQNDREIDVFLDKKGNSGKTWLAQYLWERGTAYYVPRSVADGGKVSADCCSNCGQAEYIILDIQRDKKLGSSFYADLEELKDGLVSDVRYHGKQRNLRGRKLIVFTNVALDTKKLSADRWRLHNCNLVDLESYLHELRQRRIANSTRNTKIIKSFQSNSTRNIRQTNVDKTEATNVYRRTNEVTKCTEDTQEGAMEGAIAAGATTDAETGAITEVVT